MRHELMINSDVVKALRAQRGWSQDQLAQASGIGLRTVQRVESEGRGSRETKVCLAATLEVSLAELESAPPLKTQPAYSGLPKVALVVFLIALASSIYGYIFLSEPSIAVIAANMATVGLAIYLGFSWYFPTAKRAQSPFRRTLQVGFVYAAIFLLFTSLGQREHMLNMHMSLLVSGLIFCSLYCVVLRYVGAGKEFS